MQQQTIALATYGSSREHKHGVCMDQLEHELRVPVIKTWGHAQIDIARSLLATLALAHGADVVVFIDSDILFEPLDVERLAAVARETRGIVGAPYSLRGMGLGVVGCGVAAAGVSQDVVFFDGGSLQPVVGAVGMGFTAIHRDAFALLDAQPAYAERNTVDGILRPYFQKLVVDGFWMHEDASFCHAVRQAGGSTHTDTRIRVKHLGEYAFRIEDSRPNRHQPDELTMRLTVKNEI